MIDWRTILKATPSTQYPQNTQNSPASLHSEDIEDFEYTTKISDLRLHEANLTAGVAAVDSQRSSSPDPAASPLPPHCLVTYTDTQGETVRWHDSLTFGFEGPLPQPCPLESQ